MGKKAPVFNSDNGLNQMRREIFKPYGPSAAPSAACHQTVIARIYTQFGLTAGLPQIIRIRQIKRVIENQNTDSKAKP